MMRKVREISLHFQSLRLDLILSRFLLFSQCHLNTCPVGIATQDPCKLLTMYAALYRC